MFDDLSSPEVMASLLHEDNNLEESIGLMVSIDPVLPIEINSILQANNVAQIINILSSIKDKNLAQKSAELCIAFKKRLLMVTKPDLNYFRACKYALALEIEEIVDQIREQANRHSDKAYPMTNPVIHRKNKI